jgi:hypothetical protein
MLDEEKNIDEEEVFCGGEEDIIDDDGIDIGDEEIEELGTDEEFSALSFGGARGLDE